MKRLALKSALVAVLAIFVCGGVTLAANQSAAKLAGVPAGETVDKTVFTAGDVVTIAGTVNGDVFCAGKTVFVTGTVNGDVICAGQEVRISGTVNGSVRAAGQSVSMAGTVQRAISLAGQSVSVEPDATIGGDATLAGSSVVVAGSLARDAYVGGSTVSVTGKVARNVEVDSESVTVTDGAVGGTVTQVEETPQPAKQAGLMVAPFIGLSIVIGIGLAMFVTSMVLVLIAPQHVNRLAEDTIKQPGRIVLTGLLVAFALPIVMFFLAVTLIGLPLAFFVGLVWALGFFLSGPVFAYTVGRRLLQDATQPVVIMAVGSVIVLLLYMLPVINAIVGLAAYLFGMGGIANAARRAIGKPNYKV